MSDESGASRAFILRGLVVVVLLSLVASCALGDDAARLKPVIERIARTLGRSEDEVLSLVRRESRQTGRALETVASALDDAARQTGSVQARTQSIAARHPRIPKDKIEQFLVGAGCDVLGDAAQGETPDFREITAKNLAGTVSPIDRILLVQDLRDLWNDMQAGAGADSLRLRLQILIRCEGL